MYIIIFVFFLSIILFYNILFYLQRLKVFLRYIYIYIIKFGLGRITPQLKPNLNLIRVNNFYPKPNQTQEKNKPNPRKEQPKLNSSLDQVRLDRSSCTLDLTIHFMSSMPWEPHMYGQILEPYARMVTLGRHSTLHLVCLTQIYIKQV